MKLSGYVAVAAGLAISKPLSAFVWGYELDPTKVGVELWQTAVTLLVVYCNDRWFFKGAPT